MDLSCEITRTCARVFHLTTGTFNLIVKDRIAFRLSGAPSVQNGVTPMRIRLSSKPFKHNAQSCCLSTHCAHRISTCFSQPGSYYQRELMERNRTRLPLEAQRHVSAHAEAEDSKHEKRSLGGSCDER